MADSEQEYEAILKPLREKYTKLAAFPLDDGLLVVTKPTVQAQRKYVNDVNDTEQDKAAAQAWLVVQCAVYPEDKAQVRKLLDEQPFAVLPILSRIQEMGGANVRELGKA
jgi:hypothetical protein